MARIAINIGTTANDGTGDPIRTAFTSINSMTTELYDAGLGGSTLVNPGKELTPTGANANGLTTYADDADLTIQNNGAGQLILDGASTSNITFSATGAITLQPADTTALTLTSVNAGSIVIDDNANSIVMTGPGTETITLNSGITLNAVAASQNITLQTNAGAAVTLNDAADTVAITDGTDTLTVGLTAGILIFSGDTLRVATTSTPTAGIGDVGDAVGDIKWDTSNIYVCHTAYDGVTNIWKKAALVDHV
jgi:hypothetical protein